MECGLAHPVILSTLIMKDIVRWSEPPQLENTQLTLKGTESVILLYCVGIAATVAYFLLSLLTTLTINLCKTNYNEKPRENILI